MSQNIDSRGRAVQQQLYFPSYSLFQENLSSPGMAAWHTPQDFTSWECAQRSHTLNLTEQGRTQVRLPEKMQGVSLKDWIAWVMII